MSLKKHRHLVSFQERSLYNAICPSVPMESIVLTATPNIVSLIAIETMSLISALPSSSIINVAHPAHPRTVVATTKIVQHAYSVMMILFQLNVRWPLSKISLMECSLRQRRKSSIGIAGGTQVNLISIFPLQLWWNSITMVYWIILMRCIIW